MFAFSDKSGYVLDNIKSNNKTINFWRQNLIIRFNRSILLECNKPYILMYTYILDKI